MKTKKMVYSGFLAAVGVILPVIFHLFTQGAGRIFLPIHIPVLLAGFIVGPYWAVAVALVSLTMSFLITGMPMVPTLYFMYFELTAYALASGLFYHKLKLNVYFSLIFSMIVGRAVNALALIAAAGIFKLNVPSYISVWTSFLTGLPGIVIQLILIPIIILALEKGGYLNAKLS